MNRTVLAVDGRLFEKTNDKGETRVILKLAPQLAPIKAAILPLAKNKPEIVGMAKAIAFAATDVAGCLRRYGRHRKALRATGRDRDTALRDGRSSIA